MENINNHIEHNLFMQRCLDLAELGRSNVAPNPMVGAVLVYNDKIISEGYHQFFGGKHAEIECFNNVPSHLNTPAILEQSTLYVNLEPCCHFGKTPPCTEKIIQTGIKKVVVGVADKNVLVANKGIQTLRENGIEVIENILAEECSSLNKRFFYFHTHQQPYIILKWAQSQNACIASNNLEKIAISNIASNIITHQWRADEMAILAGTTTILKDNPQLTTRNVLGKNPIRIIIDRELTIPLTHQVFKKNTNKIFVFNYSKNEINEPIEYIKIDRNNDELNQLLNILYKKNISSLIVEGGSTLIQELIKNNLWNEARIIENKDMVIINGLPAPILKNNYLEKCFAIKNDFIRIYRPHSVVEH